MGRDFESFYREAFLQELQKLLPAGILTRYDGVSCLAQNDNGEVYLMRRKADDVLVILRAAKGEAAEVASAEYAILRSLDHSCIPKALELIETDTYTYLFREYFPGETLADFIKANGIMRKEDVIDVTLQLCGILSYIHMQKPQVIHRDMKPENIIIDDQGGIRVVDFGIARVYREGATSDTLAIGTRPYMAPEQFGGMQTDGRADLFSLGVVMVFLATGRPDRANIAIRYPYRDLYPVIDRLTRIDPNQRFASAEHLARRLRYVRWGGAARAGKIAGAVTAALALSAGTFLAGRDRGYVSGMLTGEKQINEALSATRYDEGYTSGYAEGHALGYDEGFVQANYLRDNALDAEHEDYFSTTQAVGNTPSNIQNDGLAVTDGEHIYVSTAAGIERMPMDASSREVFLDQRAVSLNIYDGMLYFVDGESGISRAPLAGGEVTQISDKKSVSTQRIIMDNERIYFVNNRDDAAVYSMAPDGSNCKSTSRMAALTIGRCKVSIFITWRKGMPDILTGASSTAAMWNVWITGRAACIWSCRATIFSSWSMIRQALCGWILTGQTALS